MKIMHTALLSRLSKEDELIGETDNILSIPYYLAFLL